MTAGTPAPRRTRFHRDLRFRGEYREGALHVVAGLEDDDHDFDVTVAIRDGDHMLLHVGVVYRRAPFGECFRAGGEALRQLEGQPVGLDFKRRARAVLGEGHGCLHLRSLMTAFGDYLAILLYANHLGVLEENMDPVVRYARSHGYMADRCPAFSLGPDPDPARLVLPRAPGDGDAR